MKKHGIEADSRSPAKSLPHRRPAKGAPRVPQPLVGARFLLGVAHAWQLPDSGAPEIAVAGRSNAGKSSAINALARHARLAYASRTPGRTREINFFMLRSGALVADLPGYGYAAVTKSLKRDWQDSLWRYVTLRQNLVALILMVDARRGVTELDAAVLEAFAPSGRPVLILVTKADKLGTVAQREAQRSVDRDVLRLLPFGAPNVQAVLFSAVTRQGADAANAIIAAWLPSDAAPPGSDTRTGEDKERPRGQGE